MLGKVIRENYPSRRPLCSWATNLAKFLVFKHLIDWSFKSTWRDCWPILHKFKPSGLLMNFPERGDSIKISIMTSAGLDDAIVGGEAAKRLGIRFDLPTLPAKWICRFVVSSSTISLQFNPSAVPQSLNTRHPLCFPTFKRFNNSLSITLVLMPI